MAGTKYTIEIRYTAGGMTLLVNGAIKFTIAAAVAFSTVPTLAYWGSDNVFAQQNDAVIG